MILARSLAFNFAFFAWTVIAGTIGLPSLVAPRAVTMQFGRFWARIALALLRVIVGLDMKSAGSIAFRVAVHYRDEASIRLDTLIPLVLFRDHAAVVKRELLFLPFYGWYAARAGSISVDRKAGSSALRRLVAAARPVAAEGRPIVIFPEGTRGRAGRAPSVSAWGRRPLPGFGAAARSGCGQFRLLLGTT